MIYCCLVPMDSWVIVDVKYINHLKLIVCDDEPLIVMIKFIEILASGASWVRPWKLFHYAYGADQDLICIMGGTRACTVTFDWIPDDHGYFGSAHAWPK